MLDLEYIDHIEVYLGMSSFSKETSSAITTIKMYTKNPERESTNVAGFFTDDLYSKDIYGYSAHQLKYLSYLISFDYRDVKHKKLKYNGNDINRDRNFFDLYAQLNFKNSRIETQLIKKENDIFLGSITNKEIDDDSKTSIDYFYGGWFYDSQDKKTSANIYFTYDRSRLYEKGKYAVILPIPNFIFPVTFFEERDLIRDEKLLNLNLSRKFEFYNQELMVGVKGKYQKFEDSRTEFNGIDMHLDKNYDEEITSGFFLEHTLNFTKNDSIKVLLKYEKYFENGNVDDFEDIEARLGYIKHFDPFTFKTYFSYTRYPPAPYYLYYNNYVKDYMPVNDLTESKNTTFSAEIDYKKDGFDSSFLIARDIYEDIIFFDGIKYRVDEHKTKTNQYYFSANKDVFIAHKLRMNLFLTEGDFSGGFQKIYGRFYGGYIGLLGSFSKFEHSEILTYRDGNYNNDYGINLNITFSYFITNDLTVYLKGINLLDKALTTDYYKTDFLGNVEYLEDMKILDRRIMVGLEWEF
jgi:hypothetical protein